MENNREVKYQINPKFNLLYELGMPTGKKIRNSMFILIIFISLTIIVALKGNSLEIVNYQLFSNIKVDRLLLILCVLASIIILIKLIGTIIFQALQYNHVTYTFYNTMMIYEDDFLNQHRKNIEYKNIKEIEIRRTIWDRLLNYGVMIIYTNADNDRNNGLVIYSVKNPKYHYDVIDKLIHKIGNNISSNLKIDNDNIEQNVDMDSSIKTVSANTTKDTVNNVYNPEQDFKDSLKNINN